MAPGRLKRTALVKYITARNAVAELHLTNIWSLAATAKWPTPLLFGISASVTGIVIQIIDAGFPAENSNPYFLCVYDVDGRPWPIPASLMGRGEIIKYVMQRFGDYAASSVAAAESLTEH